MSVSSGLTEYLASYVPGLIRRQVIKDPAPIAAPSSEENEAVVLFADISGFSALTERLGEKGPAGVETLARILNDYFGKLIDLIYEHGGDVVKFAGDALIAVWPIPGEAGGVPQETLRQWTLRAAECAERIRARMLNYEAEGARLSLKLALSTGRVVQRQIGGIYNRWEFLLTGEPLVEIGAANHMAAPGDIILCPSAWALIRTDCEAAPVDPNLEQTSARLVRLKTGSQIAAGREALAVPDASQAALLPFIPGSIISRISAGQSEWLAELRKVTVLFISLPELGEETTLEQAQELMRVIQQLVYRFEGSLNKISEDDKGVMIDAAFGLPPLSHEDDPVRGLQAAMRLRAELQERGLRGSIGITTGRVFCGLVGNPDRREYTFFGNSVNLAARFVGLAASRGMSESGVGVLCDRPTFDAARENVEFQELGLQKIKGRSDPLEAFEPLHEKKQTLRAQTDLIGRVEEKTLLVNAIQGLQRGEPFQAVILHGEAGIGKSRLMEELIQQAAVSQVRVLSGEGDGIERNNSYFAWRAVFNRILGIEEILGQPQLGGSERAAIQDAVQARLGEIDPALARYAPLMDVVLPVSFPDNEFTAVMTSEARGGNIREMLVRLLQHEAARGPLLVTLEDLHWLDSASWILLGDVVQKVRPLLLAVDTRPLSPPVPAQFKEMSERSDVKFIKLDMMRLEEVEQLVCQRLGVRSLPPEAGKLIREKSEGHPFFAEELAYALRDSGVLQVSGGESRLAPGYTNLEAVVLPENLEAAITSRIDGLNPSQQLTLKVASVIGRLFAYRTLEAIHPIEEDRPKLPDHLGALTRLNLTLVEAEAPDLAYIFKHAVTQEVAYNLMLFAQRRQLHQSAAEWIEQSNQQNIQSYYTLLAYHWTQAARAAEGPGREAAAARAVEYLEKAGDQSLTNFANTEALEFFHQALELADVNKLGQLKLGQWYRKISDAYLGLGKLGEAKENLLKAMDLLGMPLPRSNARLVAAVLGQAARQTGRRLRPRAADGAALDPAEETRRMELVHMAYELSTVQFLNGDPNPLPMMFAVLAGLNVAETMKETPQLWAMYALMTALMGLIPLRSEYRHYKQRWFKLGERMDNPSMYVDGAIALSAVSSGNGEWQEVKDLIEKATAICEAMGDHRRAAVEGVAYLPLNTLLEGGPKLEEPYNRREWEIAMRRENPIHIAFAYQVDCSVMVWTGDLDNCIENARKCLALSEKSWVGDIPEYIVRGSMWLALWLKGEREGVWEAVKAALEKFSKASVVDFSAYMIHSHLAEVAFLRLEDAQAQGLPKAQMQEAEKYPRMAMGNLKKFVGIFSIGIPALHRYTGQWEAYRRKPAQALQAWRKASEEAHAVPITYEAGRADLLLGQHLPEGEEKRAHLRRAAEVFAASGYENWAQSARELLQAG